MITDHGELNLYILVYLYLQIKISQEALVRAWERKPGQVRNFIEGGNGKQVQIEESGRISGKVRVSIVNGYTRKTISLREADFSSTHHDFRECVTNLDPSIRKWFRGVGGNAGINATSITSKISGTDWKLTYSWILIM